MHSCRTPLTILAALLACAAPAAAQNVAHSTGAPPTVQAVERTAPIVLDGRLDEPTWQGAPAATGFTQLEPEEGKTATQRTEVRLAYDAEALYIGARMFDTLGAAGVRTRLARRDQSAEADYLEITFDTYHDHTGRTVFNVNPSGVKFDAGQASASADPSWDPVWAVQTRIDSLGWTAEIRIPFSQLRFPRDSVQTWGMQVLRYVQRLNELSMWSFVPRRESGGAPRFGHLEGLRAPRNRGRMELLPYVLSRARYVTPTQPGSPFQSGEAYDVRVGTDLKYQLSSTLTLDATINPDFGQVEVDPAVVNLSAFETFFSERRPFFVEGSGLFGFGGFRCINCSNTSSLSLFYSRRIGRAPQGVVSRGDAAFVHSPENSTILGAAKVTGRTRGGLQVGVMDAVTRSGRALVQDTLGSRFTEEVEPATNYFVGRVRRNYRGGNTTVGAMATSVIRRFDSDALQQRLPGHAESVGVDWDMWWKNRTYHLMGNFAFSNTAGDSLAILRLQTSSARYFQRPDRVSGGNGILSDALDPSATALRGYGGYLRMAKDAGDWQWETAVNYRSPGFEVNDAAFLTRADFVWTLANVMRLWTRPTRLYREWVAIAGGQHESNYDGDRTAAQLHAFTGGQLANYWNVAFYTEWYPEVSDDRLSRGGPVVRRPGGYLLHSRMSTDGRKKLVFSMNADYVARRDDGMFFGTGANLRVKPAPNVQFSVGPSYSFTRSTAQFVLRRPDATATHFAGQRVLFADIDQNQLSMNTRLNWTFTPTLTLELFAQPFVFAGDYSNFKEFTGPRTTEQMVYARDFGTICFDEAANRYTADPNGNCAAAGERSPQAFSFRNPDLNVRSLRGNAVLRWEYRPGSTLFLVWQQQRAGGEPFGDFDFGRDSRAIFQQRPDNIFVIKASYWIGR
ncbi:MAG: carbohydrate binding family 9 domain-containing protein [Gemmatimonadetes bacterium]|nr:carbohydrate binding family 9 domain-containing protein [Gemmatimonadota bacterium]